jgi:N-acyl-D-amino-acid deacylase
MTDTIIQERGAHNPASFGTFPRILGHYSRDLKLFSLEEAVRRMTSYSADRFGLAGTGRVVEGAWGDLVVFDPATVADNTTPERTNVPPTGIRAVLVSGEIAARDGKLEPGALRGRVLRKA